MSDSSVPMKVCNLCQQPNPETREYFYAHPSGRNGLMAKCKKCFGLRVKGVRPEVINPAYVAPVVERRNCRECGKAFTCSPALAQQSPNSGIHCSRLCRQSDTRHVFQDPERTQIQLFGKLGDGNFALVSPKDHGRVMTRRWAMNAKRYVIMKRHGKEEGTVSLHRFILDVGIEIAIDHINGDPLDNRRENLRLCTYTENARNRKKQRKPASSRYKGVSMMRRTGKWHVQITKLKVRYFLGAFSNEEEAGRAYDQKATELFGQFARLNFPVG